MADYDKLVGLLGQAFDGTAQPGSTLPILYGEYGVESQIPDSKASLYTGTEPATTRPVPEATQAAYYEQALALSFCQPNVVGMLLFLSRDERARATWQSGIHYVDGTPKTSKPRVTRALNRTTGGSIARCPGVELPVRTSYLRFGTRSAAKRGVFRVSFSCDLDCRYWVRLENAATRSDEARRQRLRADRRGRAGRSRKAASEGRHVPLHAEAGTPGEPRRADDSQRTGLPTAVGASSPRPRQYRCSMRQTRTMTYTHAPITTTSANASRLAGSP